MAIEQQERASTSAAVDEHEEGASTHDWNMVGIENGANPVSYGRDWRYILMGEAMSRATMADATALHRACENLPQQELVLITDLASAIRFESVEVAVAIAEALRTMPAIPESERDLDATLAAVVERALALDFHLQEKHAEAIINPEIVRRNRDADRGVPDPLDSEETS
jgi:hypothetical protein